MGVTEKDIPRITLIEFGAAGIDKFMKDGKSFTVEEVTKFIDDWKAKKLTKFLKSEEIPATNDEPVKVIVGKNFD